MDGHLLKWPTQQTALDNLALQADNLINSINRLTAAESICWKQVKILIFISQISLLSQLISANLFELAAAAAAAKVWCCQKLSLNLVFNFTSKFTREIESPTWTGNFDWQPKTRALRADEQHRVGSAVGRWAPEPALIYWATISLNKLQICVWRQALIKFIMWRDINHLTPSKLNAT